MLDRWWAFCAFPLYSLWGGQLQHIHRDHVSSTTSLDTLFQETITSSGQMNYQRSRWPNTLSHPNNFISRCSQWLISNEIPTSGESDRVGFWMFNQGLLIMFIPFNNLFLESERQTPLLCLPHWPNEKYSNHCQLPLIKPLKLHNVITTTTRRRERSKYLTRGYLLPQVVNCSRWGSTIWWNYYCNSHCLAFILWQETQSGW